MSNFRDICRPNRGAFNAGRASFVGRYRTVTLDSDGSPLKHIPLSRFKKLYFYSDSNVRTLAKHRIVSMFKHENRMFVAICPDYQSYDPMRLLELI